MNPFKGYVGKSVLLDHHLYVIVRSEVRDCDLQFVMRRIVTGEQTRVGLIEVLDNLLESKDVEVA